MEKISEEAEVNGKVLAEDKDPFPILVTAP